MILTPRDLLMVHPLPKRLGLEENKTRAHLIHRRSLTLDEGISPLTRGRCCCCREIHFRCHIGRTWDSSGLGNQNDGRKGVGGGGGWGDAGKRGREKTACPKTKLFSVAATFC